MLSRRSSEEQARQDRFLLPKTVLAGGDPHRDWLRMLPTFIHEAEELLPQQRLIQALDMLAEIAESHLGQETVRASG